MTDGRTDGITDDLRVAFPATPTFTRIGRVAVVGLALRLGIDVATVERLRGAVDAAVSALQGAGRITAEATWTPAELEIALTNPAVEIADPEGLVDELRALIAGAAVDRSAVTLTLATEQA